nr:MAG TPA: hypothetical protein [Caudoviricetes sp.]
MFIGEKNLDKGHPDEYNIRIWCYKCQMGGLGNLLGGR